MAASRLAFIVKKFVKKYVPQQEKFDVFKDNSVPWPVRVYYTLDDKNFRERIFKEEEIVSAQLLLN